VHVLVIGGSGFIGRFLVAQLLKTGAEVTVLRRQDATAPLQEGVCEVRGDRRRLAEIRSALRALRPDVVIDLILSSGRQAVELMNVWRGHTARLIAIGSMDVYRAVGVLHGSESGPLEPLPLTERSPLRTTLQTYPLAQLQALQSVFQWLDDEYDKIPVERAVLDAGDPSAIVLRLPMIYGPGDRLHRLYPMLKRMDDRRPVILFAKGVAEWRAPRGYVENVAAAIVLATLADHPTHTIYNVAEAENRSELEWARILAEVVGWRGEFVIVDDIDAPPALRPPGNLAQHWAVDTARIRTDLHYVEPIPIAIALQRTIDWERSKPPSVAIDYAAEDAVVDRITTGRTAVS